MDFSDGGNAGTPTAAASRGVLAAFVRFVACGGSTGLASAGVLVMLSERLALPIANALVTVLFTVVATELHHRFTFTEGRARRRWAGRAAHVGSAGTALGAYLFTTAAMLGLEALRPAAGALTEQAVYLGASGVAGIGRFLLLRWFVFAARTEAAPDRVVADRPVFDRPVSDRPVSDRPVFDRPVSDRVASARDAATARPASDQAPAVPMRSGNRFTLDAPALGRTSIPIAA